MKGYIVFGRMNPPTRGHSKLIERLDDLASEPNSKGLLYLSHTENKPADYKKAAKAESNKEIVSILKNPLTWEQKIDYVDRIYDNKFENIIICDDPTCKSLNTVLAHAHGLGIADAVLVCGQDRMDEYVRYLDNFQNDPKVPTFDSVDVISAGDRDPDSEGVDGISATKVRLAVIDGDVDAFETYIDTTDKTVLMDLFDDIERSFQI